MSGGIMTPAGKADTVMTTNGDTIYYNSGRQRLAKGSNDQVLTLASGIPSWATAGGGGKYSLLDDHIATSTESTYTYTATLSPDTYARVFVYIRGGSTAVLQLQMILNGNTSGNNHFTREYFNDGSYTLTYSSDNTFCEIASTDVIPSSEAFNADIEIFANDLDEKYMHYTSISNRFGSGRWEKHMGVNSAIATGNITSIQIKTSTSTWIAGTEIMIYGLTR